MCGHDLTDFARQLSSIETLLNDPLVRMVMHADGATKEDLLAALQIAYKAISRMSNLSSDASPSACAGDAVVRGAAEPFEQLTAAEGHARPICLFFGQK
jgi:hypothetical protein